MLLGDFRFHYVTILSAAKLLVQTARYRDNAVIILSIQTEWKCQQPILFLSVSPQGKVDDAYNYSRTYIVL